MNLKHLNPERVFHYFETISAIPRGSGNMQAISNYCMEFAKEHHLQAVHDAANNVIIYKNASAGYENAEPVILQGHLDMVCQKTKESCIDFEKDGLELYIDGDFLKAKGTTLGADNGIAVAMILAILESDTLAHPPLEAVFTTDEEIGMLGAAQLDFSLLKGKKMINLDADDPAILTVSCAGGRDFELSLPIQREQVQGTCLVMTLGGLQGGHSGVEIDAGRVNGDLLAGRLLNDLQQKVDFALLSLNGGDKGNAIPTGAVFEVVVEDPAVFSAYAKECFAHIKSEICDREPHSFLEIKNQKTGEFSVMDSLSKERLLSALLCAPNGVIEMSVAIENLVETSLNLGILKTEDAYVRLHFSLRSNKESALQFLEDRLRCFAKVWGSSIENVGRNYSPWEFKENSALQKLYQDVYFEKYGHTPKVDAIHAGLECAVFTEYIKDLDCIAIGPSMYGIHTVEERLSITSTAEVYELVLALLKRCGN